MSPSPLVTSTQVVVDDRDPSIVYSGPGVLGGTGNEYNGTTHGLAGQSSAVFGFQGTYVAAYGTISAEWGTCVVSYTLDGSLALQTNSTTTGAFVYGAPLFVSPVLGPGAHTLNIAVQSCTQGKNNGGVLWLDFLAYQPFPVPTPTSALPSPTPTGTNSTPALSAIASAPSSAGTCPASDADALRSAHVTVIVLAVMLGLVSLLALAFAALAFFRGKSPLQGDKLHDESVRQISAAN